MSRETSRDLMCRDINRALALSGLSPNPCSPTRYYDDDEGKSRWQKVNATSQAKKILASSRQPGRAYAEDSHQPTHMRGFTPHNTISSQETPSFGPRRGSPSRHLDKQQPPVFTSTSYTPPELPPKRFLPLEDTARNSIGLSDLGDSSSLFDSPAWFDFGGAVKSTNNTCPIPFVFGASETVKHHDIKMVNERSPAKEPLRRVERNGLPSTQSDKANPTKPLSSAPTFGQPSALQSPLSRAAVKEAMFFPPKHNRPEHHREKDSQADKPAHPHVQAVKDAAHKLFDPLVPRAPAAYAAPARAPIPQATGHTTTKAAPPQMYGSMGSSYGGFQPVNDAHAPITGYNYVDLTANHYRNPEPDPYTFVDPAKAQADLKALLEGAIEDEDDKPRTRSRRKKKDADDVGLLKKFKAFSVDDPEETKLSVTSDDEDDVDDGTVDGINVKLLPHQVEGLDWMTGREIGNGKKGAKGVPKGGILADDMGLGKTLQSVSLILTNPKPSDEAEKIKRKLPSGIEKTTLVVAPLALIRQWEAEIKDKVSSDHALRIYVHHGPQRTKRFQDLKKYDVVITTYQILVSEFGNSSEDTDGIKVGCFGLHWYRVILDEAHTIKNRNAKATKACYALRSEYRWCLTGTPMQNNLDELQSLIKFLRVKPLEDLREWKDRIDRPMKNGRGDVAIQRLRGFLMAIMKRRTKDILKKEGALNPGGKPSKKGDGNTTGFKVTERKIEKVFAEFSPEERKFYNRLEQRADASIEQMMSGEKVSYASALTMLLRLRQACNHPKLVGGTLGKDNEALGGDDVKKTKSSTAEIDEMANMFGALGVNSKKCEVCQLELGKNAASKGAVHCLDCEKDLAEVTQKKPRKEKKKKLKNRKHKSEPQVVDRKPRNRNIIEDSDDDDEEGEAEGSWIVPEGQKSSLRLGKAGGMADENAEGGGEWLNSEDESTEFPELKDLHLKKSVKKEVKVENSEEESDDGSASESESDTDIEDDSLLDSDEDAQLATIVTSTKISHLLKILSKEAAEHKFIVFSQFTSMLDIVEPFLLQKGYKYTRYDGSMRNDLREASLSKLRNDKNCRILLCSLKCGSLGLNLTAATRVVILEPFWNPFVEEQAIDRVHRLTQKIDVIVYKITIKDSVEERILDLQEKKRELANQTIEGGKGGVGKLGMKEILSLFRREAEHSAPHPSASQYDLAHKPRILKERERERGSQSSRESSAPRTATPPSKKGSSSKEGSVYDRRW